jgi:hypothetical protein
LWRGEPPQSTEIVKRQTGAPFVSFIDGTFLADQHQFR